MSTNATIARHNADDTYTAIYLHWDGYPESAGKTLAHHYNNEDDIRKLMDLGDLSTLGERPEDPENLWDLESAAVSAATARTRAALFKAHRLLTDMYCKSYRSRGEQGIDARTYKTEDELLENGEEYVYLWDGNEWKFNSYRHRRWEKLADVLDD